MSQDECYYLPITPPGMARMPLMSPGLGPAGSGSAHSRNTSGSSVRSCHGSSPESMMTNMTTPPTSISPNHQHGPQLLPKIRTQDVVLEPVCNTVGPRRHRRVLSNTRNPPGYVPYPTARHASGLSRNVVDTASAGECNGLISPISPHHPSSLASSGLSSPIALTTAGSAVPSVAHKRRSMPAAGGHSRSASTSSIDEVTLSRYGYPTYRQLPKYVSQSEASPISPVDPASFVFPTYRPIPSVQVPCSVQLASQQTAYSALPSPQNYDYLRVQSAQPSPVLFLAPPAPTSPSPSTTLLTYLTKTTPAVNLVRTVNYGPTRGLNDYFWWDIRQLRSWSSFSLNTFNDISGLTQLLRTPIPSHLTPHPPAISSSRLTPESENALISLVGDIYAPRINAALRVSQGSDHMKLYVSPEANAAGSKGANGPHFLANYASDTEVTASGSRRGRVVGIVKSFDRWNTGMRNEPPHRRVEYLRGLAHLQRCMREHSCRYGFIITEIELVCVRAGCDEDDDVPYFGYLELSSPIATRESASETLASHSFPSPSSSSSSSSSRENKKRRRSSTPPLSHCSISSSTSFSLDETRSAHSRSSSLASVGSRISSGEHGSDGLVGVPLTATLALYFLLMLSKSMPLPSQPSGHLNVGGPGALSRQRILPEPKDKWIPEPQLGEKREAKRVRGWIMPQDAWHRREGSRPKTVSGAKNSGSGSGESGKARAKRSKQLMTCS